MATSISAGIIVQCQVWSSYRLRKVIKSPRMYRKILTTVCGNGKD